MSWGEQEKIDKMGQAVEALLVNTGVTIPPPPDPLGAGVPAVPTVAERIAVAVNTGLSTLAGVDDYAAVSQTRTGMRNEVLRQRVNALEQVNEAQQSLLAALADRLGQQDTQLLALAANVELVRAAGASTQTQLAANTAADAALAARTTALESQEAADKLADAAQLAYQTSNNARVALLEARATQDEAAITAAQAKADAAQTAASQAIASAATAQSSVTSAATAAAAAKSQADAAASQASSNAAALTAVQAEVAKKLPADAVRRFVVQVPAVSIALAAPATVAVTLPTAFADASYELFFTKASGGLLNTELGWLNKTAAGFTLTLRNTSLATLALPAGSVEVFAIHL